MNEKMSRTRSSSREGGGKVHPPSKPWTHKSNWHLQLLVKVVLVRSKARHALKRQEEPLPRTPYLMRSTRFTRSFARTLPSAFPSCSRLNRTTQRFSSTMASTSSSPEGTAGGKGYAIAYCTCPTVTKPVLVTKPVPPTRTGSVTNAFVFPLHHSGRGAMWRGPALARRCGSQKRAT